MDAWGRFWLAVGLCVALTALLEIARLQPPRRLPWWSAHGPAIAWAAVVLIPWLIALRHGYWAVPAGPGATVPLTLPATYEFTLLALIGLAAGSAPFLLAGRAETKAASFHHARIIPARAFLVIALLCVLYVASRGLSPSRIWILSTHQGQDLYSNSRNSSFLELSIIVLAGIAIAYLARPQPPGRTGIVLYVSLVLLALGSAHRYLVMILILSYLILKNPFRMASARRKGGLTFLLALGAATWLIGFSGLGQLSAVRSGVSASPAYIYGSTLSSFDVMGSAEYVLESGVDPGQLRGASYIALPAEFVPRAVFKSKATPPATSLLTSVFGPIGASAPLWEEGVINMGAFGDITLMILIGAAWGYFSRRAVSSRHRIGKTAAAVGPVWILILYQALSRILIFATVDLCGSMIIALLLWNWIEQEPAQSDHYGVAASATKQLEQASTSI
jgi:hypothetical protein